MHYFLVRSVILTNSLLALTTWKLKTDSFMHSSSMKFIRGFTKNG